MFLPVEICQNYTPGITFLTKVKMYCCITSAKLQSSQVVEVLQLVKIAAYSLRVHQKRVISEQTAVHVVVCCFQVSPTQVDMS